MSEAANTILSFAILALLITASIWVLRRTLTSDSLGEVLKWTLVVAGPGIGIALSFLSYRPSPDLEVHGFPVPTAILQLERDAWVDFVYPPGMVLVPVILNALFVSAALDACVLAWCSVRNRRARRSRGEKPHLGG